MQQSYNARGFERKGRNNNPYKYMLRNMKVNTDKTFLKNWLKARVSFNTFNGKTTVFYKGNEITFNSVAEAVYKLMTQYNVR